MELSLTKLLAHSAQIVFNAPTKKTMIPINVTHTAIVTEAIHRRLLSQNLDSSTSRVLPKASTNLRHTLSTIITFFADSYRSTFGFHDGPPLHDALTIAYVACRDLFTSTRYRVDVELTGSHTTGETVVDLWNYKDVDDTWGRTGRNCLVATSLNVNHSLFDPFLAKSPSKKLITSRFQDFLKCFSQRLKDVTPLVPLISKM